MELADARERLLVQRQMGGSVRHLRVESPHRRIDQKRTSTVCTTGVHRPQLAVTLPARDTIGAERNAHSSGQ